MWINMLIKYLNKSNKLLIKCLKLSRLKQSTSNNEFITKLINIKQIKLCLKTTTNPLYPLIHTYNRYL